MSEVQEVQENKVVEEAVADNTTQDNEAVGGLIAESKKYRTRAQSAESELNEPSKLIMIRSRWKELREKNTYYHSYQKLIKKYMVIYHLKNLNYIWIVEIKPKLRWIQVRKLLLVANLLQPQRSQTSLMKIEER